MMLSVFNTTGGRTGNNTDINNPSELKIYEVLQEGKKPVLLKTIASYWFLFHSKNRFY